jgi:hypothetical protein
LWGGNEWGDLIKSNVYDMEDGYDDLDDSASAKLRLGFREEAASRVCACSYRFSDLDGAVFCSGS